MNFIVILIKSTVVIIVKLILMCNDDNHHHTVQFRELSKEKLTIIYSAPLSFPLFLTAWLTVYMYVFSLSFSLFLVSFHPGKVCWVEKVDTLYLTVTPLLLSSKYSTIFPLLSGNFGEKTMGSCFKSGYINIGDRCVWVYVIKPYPIIPAIICRHLYHLFFHSY